MQLEEVRPARFAGRSRMTKLSCVLLILLGSEVAGLAQTIEPADALFVADAKGAMVGRVLNTGVEKPWFEVAFRVVASGEYVRLQLFKDRIEGDATPQFESTD
jgi:hypothetical protein